MPDDNLRAAECEICFNLVVYSMTYKIAKAEVRRIVNKYDPDGLLALGAPQDEYENSINKIISLFYDTRTLDPKSLNALFPSCSRIDFTAFCAELLAALTQVYDPSED